MEGVLARKEFYVRLRNAYDHCPDKGCTKCLEVNLPILAKFHCSLGEAYFSTCFDKAIQSFKDALQWASVWKEKADIKAKIAKLNGKF